MTYSSTVPRDEWVGMNVALHRGRLLAKWLLAKALLVRSGTREAAFSSLSPVVDSSSAQPSGQNVAFS